MATSVASVLSLLLIFFHLSLSPIQASSIEAHQSFTVKLSRDTYYHAKDGSRSPNVTPDLFRYLITFSIGTPPVQILASFDTGNDTTLIRCGPCRHECPKEDDHRPLYYPKNSSSYVDVLNATHHRRDRKPASFLADLNQETLTFNSIDGMDNVSFSGIPFKCEDDDYSAGVIFGKRQADVSLGNGPGYSSLFSQIGPHVGWKFSYCMAPLTSSSSTSSGFFSFGKDMTDKSTVLSTPVMIKDNSYHINLLGILIGEKYIPFPSSNRENTRLSTNIIVTTLPKGMNDEMIKTLSTIIKHPRTREMHRGLELCYRARSFDGFPDMVFQFVGGSVTQRPMHTFEQVTEDVVCYAIVSTEARISSEHGLAIFGAASQQNFHIGIDFEKEVFQIAPADCTKV